MGKCNTINDLFNSVCVPEKAEDLNRNIFNVIAGTNESRALKTYHASMNVILVAANVTLVKSEIIINVSVIIKIIKPARKITVGILVHVFVRKISI